MGFMDKAKKIAEQAQQKLDETQGKFNERQHGSAAGEPPEGGAGGVRFDEHGRPVQDETTQAQAAAGIPVGESSQAEPGTIPPGASQSRGMDESAHQPIEGDRPAGVDHPGEGQPPAGRVETSGAAGNAENAPDSSPDDAGDANTSPDPFKRPD